MRTRVRPPTDRPTGSSSLVSLGRISSNASGQSTDADLPTPVPNVIDKSVCRIDFRKENKSKSKRNFSKNLVFLFPRQPIETQTAIYRVSTGFCIVFARFPRGSVVGVRFVSFVCFFFSFHDFFLRPLLSPSSIRADDANIHCASRRCGKNIFSFQCHPYTHTHTHTH